MRCHSLSRRRSSASSQVGVEEAALPGACTPAHALGSPPPFCPVAERGQVLLDAMDTTWDAFCASCGYGVRRGREEDWGYFFWVRGSVARVLTSHRPPFAASAAKIACEPDACRTLAVAGQQSFVPPAGTCGGLPCWPPGSWRPRPLSEAPCPSQVTWAMGQLPLSDDGCLSRDYSWVPGHVCCRCLALGCACLAACGPVRDAGRLAFDSVQGWAMCHCGGCRTHMGWRFQKTSKGKNDLLWALRSDKVRWKRTGYQMEEAPHETDYSGSEDPADNPFSDEWDDDPDSNSDDLGPSGRVVLPYF